MPLEHTQLFKDFTENRKLKHHELAEHFKKKSSDVDLYKSNYLEVIDLLREVQESQVGVIAHRVTHHDNQVEWLRDATEVEPLTSERMRPYHPRMLVNESVLRSLRLARAIDFAIQTKYQDETDITVVFQIKKIRKELFEDMAKTFQYAFDAINFSEHEQKQLDAVSKQFKAHEEKQTKLDTSKRKKLQTLDTNYLNLKKEVMQSSRPDNIKKGELIALEKKQQKEVSAVVSKTKEDQTFLNKKKKSLQVKEQLLFEPKIKTLKKIETAFNDRLIGKLNLANLAKGCVTQQDAEKLLTHYRHLATLLDPAIPFTTISKVYSDDSGTLFCRETNYPVTKKTEAQKRFMEKLKTISLYPPTEQKNSHSTQKLAMQEATALYADLMMSDETCLGAQARKAFKAGSKNAYVVKTDLSWFNCDDDQSVLLNQNREPNSSLLTARSGSPVYVGDGKESKSSMIFHAAENLKQVHAKINEVADSKKSLALICLNTRNLRENEFRIVDYSEKAINQINLLNNQNCPITAELIGNQVKITLDDRAYSFSDELIKKQLGAEKAKNLFIFLNEPVPSDTNKLKLLLLELVLGKDSNLLQFHHVPVNLIGRFYATKKVAEAGQKQKKHIKVEKIDRANCAVATAKKVLKDSQGKVVAYFNCASGQDRTGTGVEAHTIAWTADTVFAEKISQSEWFKTEIEERVSIDKLLYSMSYEIAYKKVFNELKKRETDNLIIQINNARAASGNAVYVNSHNDGGGFSGCKKVSDLGILTNSDEIYRVNAKGNKYNPASPKAQNLLQKPTVIEDKEYQALLKRFDEQLNQLALQNADLAFKFQVVREHIEKIRGSDNKKVPFELPLTLENNINLLEKFNSLPQLKTNDEKIQCKNSIHDYATNVLSIAKKIEGKPIPAYKALGYALAGVAGAFLILVGCALQFKTLFTSHGITALGLLGTSAAAAFAMTSIQQGKRKKLSMALKDSTDSLYETTKSFS